MWCKLYLDLKEALPGVDLTPLYFLAEVGFGSDKLDFIFKFLKNLFIF